MEITAKDFIEDWEEFIEDRIKNVDRVKGGGWHSKWKSNTDWSNFILGGKKSSYEISPIGLFFQDKYGQRNLGFRSEDGSVDLSLFDQRSVFEFTTLDKNWKLKPDERNDYPSNYLAIIEHENKLYTAWEEIAKLTYFHSRLKVLISYHSSDNLSEDKRRLEMQMIEKSFSSVLSKSNEVYPENPLTEYLFIMGGVVKDHLTWDYRIFNSMGNIIPNQ
ncbi:MAG: hypothetical protein ACFHWX_06095 [Bacteroidota bacterium]